MVIGKIGECVSRDKIESECRESIGASVSASLLPMNIEGWFPLVYTVYTYALNIYTYALSILIYLIYNLYYSIVIIAIIVMI